MPQSAIPVSDTQFALFPSNDSPGKKGLTTTGWFPRIFSRKLREEPSIRSGCMPTRNVMAILRAAPRFTPRVQSPHLLTLKPRAQVEGVQPLCQHAEYDAEPCGFAASCSPSTINGHSHCVCRRTNFHTSSKWAYATPPKFHFPDFPNRSLQGFSSTMSPRNFSICQILTFGRTGDCRCACVGAKLVRQQNWRSRGEDATNKEDHGQEPLHEAEEMPQITVFRSVAASPGCKDIGNEPGSRAGRK
mmetsp:Transcript_75111/g.125160  ORF Transcript_75111/g.125160 Transcript_75111/m.125160 type:complete len:245 (-) Transcript_75111:177-911(-)